MVQSSFRDLSLPSLFMVKFHVCHTRTPTPDHGFGAVESVVAVGNEDPETLLVGPEEGWTHGSPSSLT